MSASTTLDTGIPPEARSQKKFRLSWQTLLLYLFALAFLAVGLLMRFRDLGLPFDRDGYDEGVYWQSLRAMSAGHSLYQQIFYSQPPFFLLSIYPIYTFFGQTLWSARLGVAVVSLFGLLGAFLLGKALAGPVGAIVASLLLLADPFYLLQSQRLQAEAPSAALSLLAVGLAYLWWERPDGILGLCLAALSGIVLSLCILSKLLGVVTLVPIGLLMLVRLRSIWRKPPEIRLASARSVIAGVIAFILITALFLLPFAGSFTQLFHGVVTFHTSAGSLSVYRKTQPQNILLMQHLLTSITAFTALYSTIVALFRRDWRVLPLLAWLGTTVLMLWLQTPLFHHHLVALIPPLVSLAIVGISPIDWNKKESPTLIKEWASTLMTVTTAITILVLLFVSYTNWREEQLYYRSSLAQATSQTVQQDAQVVQDLQNETTPGQLVITDAQFLAGLADRNTPPALVDTSGVRILTGNVMAEQLIQEASQPQVHAVLFYTFRLDVKPIADFHTWVTQHFRLVRHYEHRGQELWIKV
jgi:4-amino-4-deoxy-L-arabinose transferase-like glycosyltransferase